MSTEMTVAPASKVCTRFSEAGGSRTLHQSMLRMQQEPGDMSQTPHTHNYESAGHGDQSLSEQSHMSKKAAREMNRAKTQEGQMISALRRMNFNESKREHNLSKKQKKRLRRCEDNAMHVPDPVKMAQRQEKAAQRAQDPERIARLELHNQKTAEIKARTQARRARNAKESRPHSSGRLLMGDIKTETSEALHHAPALQSYGADHDYASNGPSIRTEGQHAAHEVNSKLQALATVHSMPEETGTDAFLTRADSLIHQTLASNSTLSPTDRQNLEEALSLVRTVQLLSTKDYRPRQFSTGDVRFDRVIRGPDPEDYNASHRELASKDVYIKQEHTPEGRVVAQEHGGGLYGRLRGESSTGFLSPQADVAEPDDMVG